jgi:uncharacterized membrane protein YeiB
MSASITRTIPTGRALLRLALKADAVVTGANGAAYLVAAGPLGDLLGLPAPALRGIGAFLLVFAVAVWLVSERPATPAVWTVVMANAAWTVGSIVAVALDWGSPSTAGAVWTVMQAAVVGAFAAVQAVAQRG